MEEAKVDNESGTEAWEQSRRVVIFQMMEAFGYGRATLGVCGDCSAEITNVQEDALEMLLLFHNCEEHTDCHCTIQRGSG